jgi:hypothetical protein
MRGPAGWAACCWGGAAGWAAGWWGGAEATALQRVGDIEGRDGFYLLRFEAESDSASGTLSLRGNPGILLEILAVYWESWHSIGNPGSLR